MTQGADEIQRIPSPQPSHDPGPGSDHLVNDLDPEAIPFQRDASEDAEGTSKKRAALTTRSHMDELPGFDFGRNLRTIHDHPPAVLCDLFVGNDGRGNLNHNISFNGALNIQRILPNGHGQTGWKGFGAYLLSNDFPRLKPLRKFTSGNIASSKIFNQPPSETLNNGSPMSVHTSARQRYPISLTGQRTIEGKASINVMVRQLIRTIGVAAE